jgi:hypothetical protein
MMNIKTKGFLWIENMMSKEITKTSPGSISYLLYGSKPSEQSICIKMGRFGEFLTKEIIATNPNFELLDCGVQSVNEKKKDIDLLFRYSSKSEPYLNNKIIFYRELKGNIELDTEKIPATIEKCKVIKSFLQSKYPDYEINYGILNWSVYNRDIFIKGLNNIKAFEKNGIKIDHFSDFLQIMDIEWDMKDFYNYFREIGNKISNF